MQSRNVNGGNLRTIYIRTILVLSFYNTILAQKLFPLETSFPGIPRISAIRTKISLHSPACGSFQATNEIGTGGFFSVGYKTTIVRRWPYTAHQNFSFLQILPSTAQPRWCRGAPSAVAPSLTPFAPGPCRQMPRQTR